MFDISMYEGMGRCTQAVKYINYFVEMIVLFLKEVRTILTLECFPTLHSRFTTKQADSASLERHQIYNY